MKKLLCITPLVLLLCFTFACQNKAEKAELEKFRTQAKLEEQKIALVRRLYEELSKGNVGILQELFTSDFVYYSPSENVTPLSREELGKVLKTLYSVFPDFHYDIQDIFAKGDKVAVCFIAQFTHNQEFMGLPPTGKKIQFSATAIFRKFKDGTVAEVRKNLDDLGMMTQLGFELKPKEVKK
jgi:steroid delta-isomerase-like uncharacterized protein